ncbi:family 3 encapsulin nanocompartment shell protein [Nonomuraea sp. NPDC050680]|uniref:family 3 encapsulin nanocompartment shell protein n=1 Tax=Nonomuraea sp. NPDC050680 TaxID=3154630 RepID=UPI0033EFB72A
MSPGEEFAWAVAGSRNGGDVEVPYRLALTEAFPLFKTRPRYTVRHLLKSAKVGDGQVPYVHEAPPPEPARSGTSYAETPESVFASSVRVADLTEVKVGVPVPKGVLDEPGLLAAFVDYRVLVRLSTVENQILLHGSGDGAIDGLLHLADSRHAPFDGDPEDVLTAAAAEVEETGGSCDGIVTHPALYWKLVRDGALDRLATAGIRVSRTRMIGAGDALLGDFRAAVTLLDPARSTLRLRRDTEVIEASTRVGLAVHLPQHFLLVS